MVNSFTSNTTNSDARQKIIDVASKRVLIIDDIGEMRLMLKSLMSSLGYSNIDVEASGQSAIKRILEKPYDIILSDFNLGGSIDGQQILEASRKNYSQDHSTVFMMITADTAYESVVSVLEYQPDTYLVKPFPPASFFRRFERVQHEKETFKGINEARKDKNHEDMEKDAREVMEKYPHFSNQCLKIIGESLYARGHYKEAKDHYTQVIQKYENLAWAYFGIAQCEVKLGDIDVAIDNFKKTIELTRHFLSAYDELATVQESLGNIEDAQASMVSALEVSPRSVERSLRLAQLSMKIDDWIKAEQSYSKVIRLTKDTPNEKVEFYYEYLKCLTNVMKDNEKSIENSKYADKFKRTLARLRTYGKGNPAAISNSFRLEIQQHLARGHQGEAVKTWNYWKKLIESNQATALTTAQEQTLKKHLGIL